MISFSIEGQAFVPVPTVFLKEYMCDAPQDYVKVYLYGLCLAYDAVQAEDIAMEEQLHMTGAQISAAFKYWEQQGLVSQNGDSVSYCFVQQNSQAAKQAVQAVQAVSSALYSHNEYNRQLDALFSRELTHTELEKIHDYTDIFGLPHEVVLLLIQNCLASGGRNVHLAYIDKAAQDWATAGTNTVQKAMERIEDFSAAVGGARAIMRQMGIKGKDPDKTQQELYKKWTEKWGFSQETISFAMNGVEFPSSSPFKYLDVILRNLYERGITSSSGISEQAADHERKQNDIKEILRVLDYSRASVKPSHERFYNAWRAAGYDQNIILLACAQSSYTNSPRRFEAVDTLLKEWEQKGFNEAQIKKHTQQQDRLLVRIKQVYSCAGISRQITEADRKWYIALREEQHMSRDAIMYAAEISSLANDPGSFLRKVLSDWAKKGITSLDAAKKENLNRYSADITKKKSFEQHEYTESDLEQRKLDAIKDLENLNG